MNNYSRAKIGVYGKAFSIHQAYIHRLANRRPAAALVCVPDGTLLLPIGDLNALSGSMRRETNEKLARNSAAKTNFWQAYPL